MSILPASEQDVPMGRTADLGPADRQLNALERATTLTHEGRQWFVTACDPFHDKAIEIDGYPDYDATASIVQVVKRSITIAAPATLGPVGTWDCNIFSLPMLQGSGSMSRGITSPPLYNNSAPVAPFRSGTINAVGVPTGLPTWCTPDGTYVDVPNSSFAATAPSNLIAPTYTTYDSFFTDGRTRMIACGFEVINDTAPLYQQGTVTVYRQNQQATDLGVVINAGASDLPPLIPPPPTQFAGNSVSDGLFIRGPPATQSEAMLLPDSKQWHAKEGAYVTLSQCGQENHFVQPFNHTLLIGSQDLSLVEGSSYAQPIPCYVAGSSAGSFPGSAFTGTPFNLSGAYFVGLSRQTTLTINARFIIERAPTQTESDLLVLARPSPCFDEIAWRLYSAAIREMPPGVRLRDNALGSWFKNVVSTVSKVAAPLVKKVMPLASAMFQETDLGAKAGSLLTDARAASKGDKSAAKRLVGEASEVVNASRRPRPRRQP